MVETILKNTDGLLYWTNSSSRQQLLHSVCLVAQTLFTCSTNHERSAHTHPHINAHTHTRRYRGKKEKWLEHNASPTSQKRIQGQSYSLDLSHFYQILQFKLHLIAAHMQLMESAVSHIVSLNLLICSVTLHAWFQRLPVSTSFSLFHVPSVSFMFVLISWAFRLTAGELFCCVCFLTLAVNLGARVLSEKEEEGGGRGEMRLQVPSLPPFTPTALYLLPSMLQCSPSCHYWIFPVALPKATLASMNRRPMQQVPQCSNNHASLFMCMFVILYIHTVYCMSGGVAPKGICADIFENKGIH